MSESTILVIDDETEIREGLEALLSSEGFRVVTAETGEKGLAWLETRPVDLVLLDFNLPGKNGVEILEELRSRDRELPVILITAYSSVDTARAAFKAGAQDYITKPWSNDELVTQVSHVIERRTLREENRELKRALKQRYNFDTIIGRSDKMLAVLDLVSQIAPSRSTVLIMGESGTGKELIAKALHSASPRADKSFIAVNTGSIPADLLESQLFGHVKGAFTSAVASKRGLFEVADRGTIFFDEISTISPETQAKLLRVIQEREFMRLGGTETLRVDVRILAASNENLATLVRDGRFREDLYHRLNVISMVLPPLRDRKEDIPMMVEAFAERISRENGKPPRHFTPAALKLLMDYDWPGNVRELENVVERAVVLSTQPSLGADLLPENVQTREFVRGVRLDLSEFLPGPSAGPLSSAGAGGSGGAFGSAGGGATSHALFSIMEQVERRLILDMLERTAWNQTEAAERFQIPLSTLNQKIKRLGIEIRRRPSRPVPAAAPGPPPSSPAPLNAPVPSASPAMPASPAPPAPPTTASDSADSLATK